jgi:hypothetical protein
VSSNPTSTTSTARARRNPLHTRRGRAGLAGSAVLLAALPLLAACSAGNNPQAYQVVPDNGEGKSGYMYVNNVWVVYDQSTGNAEVIGAIANTDPTTSDANQLTGVTLGGSSATITAPSDTSKLAPGVAIAGNTVNIPALKSVQFGQPGQPEIGVQNADLTIGNNVDVTYTFSNGTPVTVAAIVQPNSGLWQHYDPNGANGASASASASATGIGTATATPTGTATGTATAGATDTSTATATGTGSATASATASASATKTP